MDRTLETTAPRHAADHPSYMWAVALAAMIVVIVIMAAFVITALPAVGRATGGIGSPERVAFRAGERATAAAKGDALVQPTLIDFRAGERATAAAKGDALVQPTLIDFRAGERDAR